MSQFTQLLGSRLGLEDLVEDADLSAVVTDGDDTVEAAVSAAQTDEAAVVDAEAQSDTLMNDVVALESIAFILEHSLATGGMNKHGMALTKVTLRGIGSRMGLEHAVVASLESIAASKDNVAITTATLESVKDMLKGWWASFKSMVEKLFKRIRDWVNSLLDVVPRIKKRAEAIKAKAKTSGKPFGAKTVKYGSISRISIGNEKPKPNDLCRTLGQLRDYTRDMLSSDHLGETEKALTALFNRGASDKVTAADISELNKKFNDVVKALPAKYKATIKDTSGLNGVLSYHTQTFPGDCAVSIASGGAMDKNATDKWSVSEVKMQVIDLYAGKTRVTNSGELDMMESNHVEDTLNAVLALCDIISGYKKGLDARDKSKQSLMAAIEKAVNGANKAAEGSANDTELAKTYRDAAKAASTLWNKSLSLDAKFISYLTTTMMACLSYADKCVA